MKYLAGIITGIVIANVWWFYGTRNYSYPEVFNKGVQHEKDRAQAFRDSIRNNCTYGNVIDTLYAVDRKAIQDNFPKPNLKKMIGK